MCRLRMHLSADADPQLFAISADIHRFRPGPVYEFSLGLYSISWTGMTELALIISLLNVGCHRFCDYLVIYLV